MISTLEKKYKKEDEWIHTRRRKTICYDEQGNVVDDPIAAIFKKKMKVTHNEIEVDCYEGLCSDYWEPTAANAIKPLYQLKCLAQMRPDCIWDGD